MFKIYSLPSLDLYLSFTVCALMVIPLSLSISIESNTCSFISRSVNPPHNCIILSAIVDLP